jgi:hypothetical protein
MAQLNTGGTLLTSAARTATTQSPDQDNSNGQAVVLYLDITASPNNAETLTVSIQGKDPVSGKYGQIVAFTALAGTTVGANPTTATYLYTLDPEIATAALANQREVKQGRLPRGWRAQVAHSAGGSWTYSLGAAVN